MNKSLITASIITLSLLVLSGCVHVVRHQPPPPKVEVLHAPPYAGAVWIKGHWMHKRGDWLWVSGHWKKPPGPKAAWAPGRWQR